MNGNDRNTHQYICKTIENTIIPIIPSGLSKWRRLPGHTTSRLVMEVYRPVFDRKFKCSIMMKNDEICWNLNCIDDEHSTVLSILRLAMLYIIIYMHFNYGIITLELPFSKRTEPRMFLMGKSSTCVGCQRVYPFWMLVHADKPTGILYMELSNDAGIPFRKMEIYPAIFWEYHGGMVHTQWQLFVGHIWNTFW